MSSNRIQRFWHLRPRDKITLEDAYAAADGDAIDKATGGLITALASSEGTEFLLTGEHFRPCRPGRDARKHLARELRQLALRCTQAARGLEGGVQ
ncbi:MAG: hypothetical protein KY475_11975 [Planctomycetes bacterium]|nr:hypothetical protein [Planctomycetota bacterium]